MGENVRSCGHETKGGNASGLRREVYVCSAVVISENEPGCRGWKSQHIDCAGLLFY